MGNILNVQCSCDTLLTRCWDYTAGQALYVCKLEENLKDLEIQRQKLEALWNDKKNQVKKEEGLKQLQPLHQVQGWLKSVEDIITEVDEIIRNGPQEVEKLCVGGCCSKNFMSSYKFGKKIAKKLQDVDALKREGDTYKEVAVSVPEPTGDERPSEPTVGLESTFEKVWRSLTEEDKGIIGLHGMGGVGKTTLLTQINNRLLLGNPICFDFVRWVVVSKDHNLENIQHSIGKKIGFSDESWKNKSQDEKKIDIFRILSKKRFALLLDDMWERVNLANVGVPLPNKQNGSKIVFTTRSEEVCGQMEAQRIIKVECLNWDKAWELFKQKVGEETLNSHREIPKLAKIVAEGCDGLPLALIVIGRAMARKKKLREWKHAIEVLNNSASKFPEMRNKVLPRLKFSYDNLSDDKEKNCFLYCSLFPEDYACDKNTLIDYWIGEGFLEEYNEEPQNVGHFIIGTLVNACLLEEVGDQVKMHDVIRDMALWIASDCGKAKDKYLVRAKVDSTEAPKVEEWEGVERMSLMDNRIEMLPGRPTCSHLLTLLLQGNELRIISNDFFEYMSKLRALDLSRNQGITKFPQGVSNLVLLQYLNLSRTNIGELPIELKMLVNLKYLNLEYTVELTKFPLQVISSLVNLQVLRMYSCGKRHLGDQLAEGNILSGGSESLIKELQCLKNLNLLTVDIRSDSALQKISSLQQLKRCVEALYLSVFRGTKLLNTSFFERMHHLEMIRIDDCESLEKLEIDLHSITINRRCFDKLCDVRIFYCPNLGELTWLKFAPNLKSLKVYYCSKMEEIISSRKLNEVEEVVENLNPFAKLKTLDLYDLPNLGSIYWNVLPFPCLKGIYVYECPKLKKLPLDSDIAMEDKLSIRGEQEWWDALKWDEATKHAFLPCFKPW